MTQKSKQLVQLAATVILMSPMAANALPILNIDPATGKLLGASYVNVDGTFYDVAFLDGTCGDLFDGCDEDSDFPFSETDPVSAAQAIIVSVFRDSLQGSFDTDPELTAGCESTFACSAVTPWRLDDEPGERMLAIAAINGVDSDEIDFEFPYPDGGYTNSSDHVWAVWTLSLAPPTPIVDPITGELLGARNVQVDGKFYDVAFLDGTCIELYDGCDEYSDFPFGDQQGSSSELLEQVLINSPYGQFDTIPELTAGCETPGNCRIYTQPLVLHDEDGDGEIEGLTVEDIVNNESVSFDWVDLGFPNPDSDTTTQPSRTWAVLTLAVDTDADGNPDFSDPDDDNDGIADAHDIYPLVASNWCFGSDSDNAQLSVLVEVSLTCAARVSAVVRGTTQVLGPPAHLHVIAPFILLESGFSSGKFTATSADPCPGCAPTPPQFESRFTVPGGSIFGHLPVPQNNGFDYYFTPLMSDPVILGGAVIIESVEVSSFGHNNGAVVNFDWEVHIGPAPFGLPEGQFIQTLVDPVSGYTRNAPTQFHFVIGDQFDDQNYYFSSRHDFITGATTANPYLSAVHAAFTSPMNITDGLYAKVFLWTADNRNSRIDFGEITLIVRGRTAPPP